MAWWGVSLASGPQYNHPVMTEERTTRAWSAMQKAMQRIEHTSPVERALIEALQFRNANPEPEDRTHLNEAYAEAMSKIWDAYPEDSDVGTLYAEAMMVRRPWELFSLDHQPHIDTPKVIAALERVMELDVSGVKSLELVVENGGEGNGNCWSIWGSPEVSR